MHFSCRILSTKSLKMDEIDIKYPIKQEVNEEVETDNLIQVKLEVLSDEEHEIKGEIEIPSDEPPEIKEEIIEDITENVGFKCTQCRKKFPDVESVKSHVENDHRKASCSRCNNKFNSIFDCEDHKTRCRLTCLFCGTLITPQNALERHEKAHADALLKKSGRNALTEYYPKINELKCGNCDKLFGEQKNLNMHEQVCTGAKLLSKLDRSDARSVESTIDCLEKIENLKCRKCGMLFSEKRTLTMHEQACKETRLLGSSASTKTACTRIIALRMHGKAPTHDPKTVVVQVSFPCKSCKQSFPVMKDLITHQRIHNLCKLCGVFLQEEDRTAHESICTGKIPLPCTYCHKIFSNFNTVYTHGNVHRKEETLAKFFCYLCKKSFSTKEDLSAHRNIKIHRLKCMVCDQEFIRRKAFTKHTQRCKGPPYVCAECKQTFTTLSELKSHENFHEFYREVTVNKIHEKAQHTQDLKTVIPVSFPCKSCQQSFSVMNDLINHQKIHAKAQHTQDPKTVEPVSFPCKSCQQSFPVMNDLIAHQKIHNLCKLCGVFLQEDKRSFHESICTGKILPCSYCHKIFSNYNTVFTHGNVHKKEESLAKFFCYLCKKSFSTKEELSAHQTINVRRLKCTVCDQEFIRRKAFTKHTQRCKGPPFVCSECKQAFTTLSDLKSHENFHEFYREVTVNKILAHGSSDVQADNLNNCPPSSSTNS